ncbi:MAG: DUF3365 domain-containing protein [Eggerthellaceae bacterium]|nr:DUF3365 domain-containing protein [Eggerthellaceae bacterium]
MRRISLKTLIILTIASAFTLTFLLFVCFDSLQLQKHSKETLLEQARTFADEMDAVWTFMDNSQTVINTGGDGSYHFKGLHCSIVGKSVGAIFSYDSEYTIRYTNFNPRNLQDRPDAFEAEALTAFLEDPTLTEYYGYADFDGDRHFRYLRKLEVDAKCLTCHGEPVGERDITGAVREGWTLESLGGAISIIVPIEQQRTAVYEDLRSDIIFFLLSLLLIGAVVLLTLSRSILRPLTNISDAFDSFAEKRRVAPIENQGSTKEIRELTSHFENMTGELQTLYSSLEEQVAERTVNLRRANALLEEQRKELEDLSIKLAKESQFKSDMLSMVNHELRTSLTSILTLTQVVEEKAVEASEAVTDLDSWNEVQKNSKILLEMINNMLDMARSDAGQLQANIELVDLGDVLTAAGISLVPLATHYKVDYTTHINPDVPLVMGDFEKLQRSIENLVSNAIKFTPDGGSAHVEVSCDEAGDVLIAVSDTGIGIDPADQERVFERFVQVDSTSTRKYNGSGLGLALVRQYCELQHFTISVESALGAGTTFTIRIPAEFTE